MLKPLIITTLLVIVTGPLAFGNVEEIASLNAAEARIKNLILNSQGLRVEASKTRDVASNTEEDRERLKEFEDIFADEN